MALRAKRKVISVALGLSAISVWNLACSAASHTDTGPFTRSPCEDVL